ncbi:MAG: hypothetical protein CMN30_01565 [Sandaracinus sp.]|nr:hypothetical protein [Sandaracinus sp.]
MRLAVGVVALACTLAANGARAQELDPEVTDRCVRAAVKITMLADGGGGSTGSGTLIDPRGYVLTNFHVVGHLRPGNGIPGTLLNRANRVQLATVESARQSARPRWIGAVVRADARLDLALVRILSDTDGNPIQGAPFPTIPMAGTEALRPGSPVWAFGYPLGVRTINVTGGSVAGFQMNGRDEVAWLRTDTEFNPGNSGGMLVDRQGQLVALPTRVYHGRALEPVEMARPAERMPEEWRRALASGAIDRLRIDGVRELRAGGELVDEAVGDSVDIDRPVDQHYWRPAPDLVRPARITLDGRHPIAVMRGDTVVREGMGTVDIQADDGDVVISILLVNPQDAPVTYRVGVESREAAAPPREVLQEQPVAPAGSAAPTGAVLTGTVVNATNGQPLDGAWVFVARPGVDPSEALELWTSGRLTQDQLRERFITAVRTNVRGEYVFDDVPVGRWEGVAAIDGFRFAPVTFVVREGDTRVELRPIQMTP